MNYRIDRIKYGFKHEESTFSLISDNKELFLSRASLFASDLAHMFLINSSPFIKNSLSKERILRPSLLIFAKRACFQCTLQIHWEYHQAIQNAPGLPIKEKGLGIFRTTKSTAEHLSFRIISTDYEIDTVCFLLGKGILLLKCFFRKEQPAYVAFQWLSLKVEVKWVHSFLKHCMQKGSCLKYSKLSSYCSVKYVKWSIDVYTNSALSENCWFWGLTCTAVPPNSLAGWNAVRQSS